METPPGAGATVHFTPDASPVMSSGTVTGGKNGDTWINTSGGNQVNQWKNGQWVPITWDATSVINASTINSGLIAAGTVIAGVVDGTVVQGATIIAYGTAGEFLVYSGIPTAGNLIGSWSGLAGSDAYSNPYAQGLQIGAGGLILNSQGSPPAGVTGASELYTSSSGRLRYQSETGADMVLDRSNLNLTNKTMGTQTIPVQMSQPLSYLANEAQAGSEYEIEIDGTITTPTTVNTNMPVYNSSLFVDGAGVGANNVTFGTTFLASGLTIAYCIRWRVTINSVGAAGTCDVIADGGAVIQFNGASQFNLGNSSPTRTAPGGGGGQGSTPVNQVTTGVAFDTTANHTIAVYNNWGSTLSSGHSAITYRTKITRRNLCP